jgi:predicted HTH transcriptional regulator
MSVVHTLRARRALPSPRACGEGAPDLRPGAGVPEILRAAPLMSSSARVEQHRVSAKTSREGRVVVFEIPSRPPGTAYHLDGRYLMRSGSALVPMSEDRLRRVFAEGKKHWLDERFASGLSAEDAISRLDIGRYFELLKLPQPYSIPPILERLEADRIILRDGATYSITNLGQILFARNLARFGDIGRKAARVISYEGTGKTSTLRDHIITRGYAASFEHIIELVELQTPVREVIERALRREERAYPSVAVRELIANALIHQDLHTYGASVVIELYADRLEISNPGQPHIQFDRSGMSMESR